MMIACAHADKKRFGRDRKGNQRYRCLHCGKTWTEIPARQLGPMRTMPEKAKLALQLLTQGMSIRATERTTGIHRDTICKLIVHFGSACRDLLDRLMVNLQPAHLQFDEQWTYVGKKQSRLTVDEKAESSELGDVYIWTCIDQRTKLMPSFLIGKRSADNARRFMMDVAARIVFPKPHSSDAHAFEAGGYRPTLQISTDGFPGYPEAVDLAFGPWAKFGTIIKDYRNATMIYTPSEMVGTKRTGIRGIGDDETQTICTSHIERMNGTNRVFLKRLNRLTYAFSKKLANLEAAFAMYAAYYNLCWQTRRPGKSGKRRPTAAMMAGVAGHVWSFDELFAAALNGNRA
jgi:transposase-like protein/IS1 family transposase